MPKIDVYTTNYCPFCTRAKDLLKRKNAPFTEHDITNDQQARMDLVDRTNGRKTVPQIFINDALIGGFDDLSAMEKDGKLDALLNAN